MDFGRDHTDRARQCVESVGEHVGRIRMRREYASIKELLRVVDEYIPSRSRDVDKPFMMSIEDVSRSRAAGRW